MAFFSLVRRISVLAVVLAVLWQWTTGPDVAWATGSGLSVAPVAQLPELSLKFGSDNGQPSQVAMTVELLLMLTVLSLAPSILIMMTSFTRIIVVLSFLRQAMGTAQVPPNQVMIGLSLFLTFFIMAPVYKTMDDTAITPYLEKRMAPDVALTEAMKPVRSFMMRQVRKKDLALFMKIGHLPDKVKSPDDIPTYVLIPAFVISELSTAFEMGFMIYLPFLILDMVVSSVLMSMGMMMLPPTVVSMPFKILLFVLVDGWSLVVGSLVQSFH